MTTKVFIEGASQAIKLAEPGFDEIAAQIDGESVAIQGKGPHGAPVLIPVHRVIDVVGPTPEPASLDEDVMWGRKVTLRDYATWRKGEDDEGTTEVWDVYEHPAVVVLGEDLGETPVLVARASGRILWANPANPDGATERYAQIVRLTCEAETLVNREYAPAPTGAEPDLTPEAEREAQALLASGDVRAAVRTAGEAYVAAFLAGCVSMGEVHGTKINGRVFRVLGDGTTPTTLVVRQPVGDESDDTEDTVVDVAEIQLVVLPD